MADGIIALFTGALLIFSGFLSKKRRIIKKNKKRDLKIDYVYILAGLLLVILGILHQV